MSAEGLAAALGRVPSGLFVVTIGSGTDDLSLLASWVQQCSFDPPMLSVALRQGRDALTRIVAGDRFAVNILAEGQKDLLGHFGKGLSLAELPHAETRVVRTADLAPVLTESLGVLHCEYAGQLPAGDHHIVLARIVAGSLHSDARPGIHVRKSGLHY